MNIIEKPFLSMIIPVYKVEPWLRECLDTCVCQNIPDDEYEIICIDDGSPDNCGMILDEYAARYNQLRVIHKENGGVSSARNVGIDNARGEYLWFIDSDDFIAENCLRSITDRLTQTRPDMLFIKPFSFADGQCTDELKIGHVVADTTTEFFGDWMWTRLYRTEAIRNSQVRFDITAPIAQDNLFCTEVNHFIYSIDYLDLIAYFYRRRENSTSTTSIVKKIPKMISTCKAFNSLKQRHPDDTEKADKQIYTFVTTIMSNLAKMPSGQAKTYIRDMKEAHLYPLPKKSIAITEDLSGMDADNRKLTELRYSSYTKSGYRSLRRYRLYLKAKRRLFKS